MLFLFVYSPLLLLKNTFWVQVTKSLTLQPIQIVLVIRILHKSLSYTFDITKSFIKWAKWSLIYLEQSVYWLQRTFEIRRLPPFHEDYISDTKFMIKISPAPPRYFFPLTLDKPFEAILFMAILDSWRWFLCLLYIQPSEIRPSGRELKAPSFISNPIAYVSSGWKYGRSQLIIWVI